MKNTKLLTLLIAMVIFVNYINYILPDRDKQQKKIEIIKRKIDKEKKLNKQNIDIKQLSLPYDKFFFNGKKYNYSEAMGKMQEIITKSAKGECKIRKIKWAQVSASTLWYDRLTINLSFACKPKKDFIFINKLRKYPKLFYINNFKIYNDIKKKILIYNMQIVGYRLHNEK